MILLLVYIKGTIYILKQYYNMKNKIYCSIYNMLLNYVFLNLLCHISQYKIFTQYKCVAQYIR